MKYGLVRTHIREQFEYRKIKANPDCHSLGKCVNCGCLVPDVFMADKPCDAGCYPPMMDKKSWQWWKQFYGFKQELNNPRITEETWTTTSLDLGSLHTGQKSDFIFTYLGPYKLKSAKGACGCTSVKIIKNNIIGVYTAIKTSSVIDDKKTIRVVIETPFGELTDVLTISARVEP